MSYFLKPVFGGILLIALLAGTAVAQAPAAAENTSGPASKKFPEGPHVRIAKTDWGPRGELVLAVQIHAGKTSLALGKYTADTETGQGVPIGFSLEESTLEDRRSGERLTPLLKRPRKPYFGPIATVLKLQPKGWVQLGVAFPHPPSPGKNAKGEANPYRLVFHPPGKFSPVSIEIPYSPKAEAAARPAQPRTKRPSR